MSSCAADWPLLEPPCSSEGSRGSLIASGWKPPPTTWPLFRSFLRESFIPERHIDIHTHSYTFIHIQGEKEAPAARELRTKTPW